MDKPFSYLIYQQGKRFYQQNRFGEIDVNNNKVKGYVLDQKAYEVKLIFNQNKQLTGKVCTCDYSIQYHECKHMAALYMKVVGENYLDVQVKKLRNFYDVYIAQRARPQVKDYSDFEYKIRVQLEIFRRNNMLEHIKQYCDEFSKINYPATRMSFMLEMFKDVIESLMQTEENKEEIEKWIYISLSNNKNIFLHDTFLSYIQKKTSKEIYEICDELLGSMPVRLNDALSSKLLLMSYKNSQLSLSEFLKNHERYENTEAMYLLKGEEYLKNKEYLKAIELTQDYFRKNRYPTLQEEMKLISKRAHIGYDPMRFIQSYIDKLSFWNRDLSELAQIKEIIGEEWRNIRVDVYNQIARKVDSFTFEKILHEQNEWEYAVYLIYEKPNFNNLKNYLDLIRKNAPEMVDSLVFECLVNNAHLSNTFGSYDLFINRLEYLKREIKDPLVMEYILYYLKKFNADKTKLVEMLDKMGDEYEA